MSRSSKKIKRVVRSSLAAETSSMEACVEQLDWMRVFFGHLRGCFEKATSVIGDRAQESARRASHVAIELAIVRSRATEGEADLRWTDARQQTQAGEHGNT